MRLFNNILLLLCFTSLATFAQQSDSVRAPKVAKELFIPTGLRIGYDAMALGRTQFSSRYEGMELAFDTDIYRYFPTLEIGTGKRNFTGLNGSTYNNSGSFWRFGVDVNFMKKDPEKNMFFLGLRYGRSTYSENATLVTTDPVWGNYNKSFSNSGLHAQWLELTMGMKVKVWKIFWLGYTSRFKFKAHKNDSLDLRSSDIPGYGSTDKPSTWGFSYYLLVKLPVPKKK